MTIALPPATDSVAIGGLIQEAGYRLSFNSEHLRRRNWIQVCLMGECRSEKCVSLLNAVNRVCFRRKQAPMATEAEPTARAAVE